MKGKLGEISKGGQKYCACISILASTTPSKSQAGVWLVLGLLPPLSCFILASSQISTFLNPDSFACHHHFPLKLWQDFFLVPSLASFSWLCNHRSFGVSTRMKLQSTKVFRTYKFATFFLISSPLFVVYVLPSIIYPCFSMHAKKIFLIANKDKVDFINCSFIHIRNIICASNICHIFVMFKLNWSLDHVISDGFLAQTLLIWYKFNF